MQNVADGKHVRRACSAGLQHHYNHEDVSARNI